MGWMTTWLLQLQYAFSISIHNIHSFTNALLQVIQLGEVTAIMVGLHHGLGQTQDLLRQSEVEQASRVRATRVYGERSSADIMTRLLSRAKSCSSWPLRLLKPLLCI